MASIFKDEKCEFFFRFGEICWGKKSQAAAKVEVKMLLKISPIAEGKNRW